MKFSGYTTFALNSLNRSIGLYVYPFVVPPKAIDTFVYS